MNAGVQNLAISLGAMQGIFFSVLTHTTFERKNSNCPKNAIQRPGSSDLRSYQLTALAIYYYLSMTVCFPVFSSFAIELVLSGQDKERLIRTQIRLALSIPFYSSPRSSASFSGACVTHGSFNPHSHPQFNPLLPLLQSSDQKGELVTTTVRDYDLSETSKLVRPHPSSLILLYSQFPHASSAPRTWVSS